MLYTHSTFHIPHITAYKDGNCKQYQNGIFLQMTTCNVDIYCRLLSELSDSEPCSGLQFSGSACQDQVEKCYSHQFSAEMKDFFLERAIQFKQWMVLAKKLLDITHAKSVFYFFSPFLLQFCLMNELKWYHIFYEECLHVKR